MEISKKDEKITIKEDTQVIIDDKANSKTPIKTNEKSKDNKSEEDTKNLINPVIDVNIKKTTKIMPDDDKISNIFLSASEDLTNNAKEVRVAMIGNVDSGKVKIKN